LKVPSHLILLDVVEVKLHYVLLVLPPEIGLVYVVIIFHHNLTDVQVVPPSLQPARACRLRVLILRVPPNGKAGLHFHFEISSLGASGMLCGTPATIMLHEFRECLQMVVVRVGSGRIGVGDNADALFDFL
jgi:hypothetical protein